MRNNSFILLALLIIAAPSWAIKKESYEKKVENDLTAISQKIDQWRVSSEKAGEHSRTELENEQHVLDEKLTEARKKLDELKAETEKSWKPLRNGVDQAVKDLSQTFSRVKSKKPEGGK